MYKVKRLVQVAITLLALAACTQVPIAETDSPSSLEPMAFGPFGSSAGDAVDGLSKHSSGVYAVGSTSGNLHGQQQGISDLFIRKYSSSGTVLWGRQYGTTAFETAEDIASDSADNAYVVGYSQVLNGQSDAPADALIRKYTANGGLVWSRSFGTSARDFAYGVAVSGAHIYVVGKTYVSSMSSTKSDAFVRKYNASGGVVWTKQFGTDDDYYSNDDLAHDVAVDGSGNVYVAGVADGSLPGTAGYGAFIRKYNSSGNVVWTKQSSYGSVYDGYASARSYVVVYGSSVYLIANDYPGGIYQPPHVHVVKYSTSGSAVFDKTFYDTYATDAGVDSSGNVYFGGESVEQSGGSYDFYGSITKVNPSGSAIWSERVQVGDDLVRYPVRAVAARSGSEVYVAGIDSGGYDAYVRRLNSTSTGGEMPLGNFTYSPINVYLDDTVTLDGSTSRDPDGGSIITYTWRVTDPSGKATTFSGVSPQFKASVEGNYRIGLTVTDDERFQATAPPRTMVVSVRAPTINSFTASPTELTGAGTTLLSWTITGKTTEVTITPNVGVVTSRSSIQVNVATTTTFMIQARNGLASAGQRSVTVTVRPIPSVRSKWSGYYLVGSVRQGIYLDLTRTGANVTGVVEVRDDEYRGSSTYFSNSFTMNFPRRRYQPYELKSVRATIEPDGRTMRGTVQLYTSAVNDDYVEYPFIARKQ